MIFIRNYTLKNNIVLVEKSNSESSAVEQDVTAAIIADEAISDKFEGEDDRERDLERGVIREDTRKDSGLTVEGAGKEKKSPHAASDANVEEKELE